TTPELRYLQGRNEITSDSAFVLTDSTHREMTGIGFASDPDMKNVRCFRACAGTAGIVTLPGAPGDSAAARQTPAPAGASRAAPAAIPPSAGSRAVSPSPRPGRTPAARSATPPGAAGRPKTFTLPGHGTP